MIVTTPLVMEPKVDRPRIKRSKKLGITNEIGVRTHPSPTSVTPPLPVVAPLVPEPVRAGVQQAWDAPVVNRCCTEPSRACLTQSGDFLHAVPCSPVGTRLDDTSLRIAIEISLRLGATMCAPHTFAVVSRSKVLAPTASRVASPLVVTCDTTPSTISSNGFWRQAISRQCSSRNR
jgi:hypothetical protein